MRITDKHKELDRLRQQIHELWPVTKGSLSHVRKPCIRSKCRACASGKKHPVWLFSFRQAGRRRCMYVPEELVPTLKRALENGRKLEALMADAGAALLQDRDRELGESTERC
jgi:hypothetical protein